MEIDKNFNNDCEMVEIIDEKIKPPTKFISKLFK